MKQQTSFPCSPNREKMRRWIEDSTHRRRIMSFELTGVAACGCCAMSTPVARLFSGSEIVSRSTSAMIATARRKIRTDRGPHYFIVGASDPVNLRGQIWKNVRIVPPSRGKGDKKCGFGRDATRRNGCDTSVDSDADGGCAFETERERQDYRAVWQADNAINQPAFDRCTKVAGWQVGNLNDRSRHRDVARFECDVDPACSGDNAIRRRASL